MIHPSLPSPPCACPQSRVFTLSEIVSLRTVLPTPIPTLTPVRPSPGLSVLPCARLTTHFTPPFLFSPHVLSTLPVPVVPFSKNLP
ncbi:hypothetical protein CPAR01_14192 [Colletotrichum paranaense]|uniref:Uncharacterized protein n=4 Tax=Colletotrichum acutatum species complex TaxID=2707335 RepID=A0A9Q8WD05_9PEZI|nr:uncharacterized protein CLUP02_03723 [Colletotrichum lupini]XP_060343177.1 uncharacterized protein CPAR01_14192 [Colletotrichum paranaense]KAK1462721.1 hypothetical protein CMEL01_13832 [Colletotrichum melonis]KAK1497641.1 hypothetical protein CCUS01_13034 [Colletotrichum cuscutae]KAK1523339.1 hypothetical protein CPAR01_14192 [Colletotrichum paranaense]UQC78247.1 hypothetical protein CLUP02_03723 [Colletotrichum lupini]